MTRISENYITNMLVGSINRSREQVAKYSDEVSSGVKVQDPGDSPVAGTISQLNSTIERVDSYKSRISTLTSMVTNQNDILSQVEDVIIRAEEIATQGANETVGTSSRTALAQEVFALRDQLVSLANSKFEGSYIFSGAADNTPAYSATTYQTGTDGGLQRYVYTTAAGSTETRDVRVTDTTSLTTNIPGNEVFDQAVQALERLGRSLSGYKTNPATGAPDGTGDAYTSSESSVQTADIQNALDLLEKARTEDVMPAEVTTAARLNRLQAASSLLELSKASSQDELSNLRDADEVEAATNLSMAETALEASMSVTAKVMQLSILDYI